VHTWIEWVIAVTEVLVIGSLLRAASGAARASSQDSGGQPWLVEHEARDAGRTAH
jgi:hypothetical protein